MKRSAAGWAAPLEQAYVERIFSAGGEQETQRGRRRFGLFARRAEQAGERVVSGGGDLQAPYLARVDARFPVQHRAEDAACQCVFGGPQGVLRAVWRDDHKARQIDAAVCPARAVDAVGRCDEQGPALFGAHPVECGQQ